GIRDFHVTGVQTCALPISLQQLVARVLKGDNLTFLGDGASQDSQATGSGLRHDLRTPLNAIKGYGEMLLEETLPEPFARDLQKQIGRASCRERGCIPVDGA